VLGWHSVFYSILEAAISIDYNECFKVIGFTLHYIVTRPYTGPELNWQPLASRRRTARLVLFHKIHYGLVAINMPLELKHNSGPTRTENSLAYHIPASSVDYQKNSFFYKLTNRPSFSGTVPVWDTLYRNPERCLGDVKMSRIGFRTECYPIN